MIFFHVIVDVHSSNYFVSDRRFLFAVSVGFDDTCNVTSLSCR